ncbi:TPA: hypothetical protein EYP27_05915 [Candidatus Bathyarchaeota archaeon]|nr:hypothetical protein [Candidatus Bathyarchaeota archaeon]
MSEGLLMAWRNLTIPFHWTHDKTGILRRVLEKFFGDEKLNFSELNLLRWYVYQWVHSHYKKPENYKWIRIMSQKELKKYILEVLVRRYGILPF